MCSGELVPFNALKRRLSKNELSLCMAIRLVTQADIVLLAKSAGYDAIYLDLEHASLSPESCRQIAVTAIAAELTCLVRVPRVEEIGQLLDAGAAGVIFPDVVNAEQARAVVAAVKFPPLGRRSVSSVFASYGFQPVPAAKALPALNETTMVVLQIESVEGLDNVDDIVATEGVDMILVGTNDLLADMGLPGQFTHKRVEEAFSRIVAACKKRWVAVGIGGLSGHPALVSSLIDMGCTFISVGGDLGFLASAASEKATMFRAMDPRGRTSSKA